MIWLAEGGINAFAAGNRMAGTHWVHCDTQRGMGRAHQGAAGTHWMLDVRASTPFLLKDLIFDLCL